MTVPDHAAGANALLAAIHELVIHAVKRIDAEGANTILSSPLMLDNLTAGVLKVFVDAGLVAPGARAAVRWFVLGALWDVAMGVELVPFSA